MLLGETMQCLGVLFYAAEARECLRMGILTSRMLSRRKSAERYIATVHKSAL